jgi:hypothetical protein
VFSSKYGLKKKKEKRNEEEVEEKKVGAYKAE